MSGTCRLDVTIPPPSKFSLPEVLDYVSRWNCKRVHLIDYLKSGKLKAVCFPFCQEPDRLAAIKPDQWKRDYRDDWSFPVYAGWIGNMDVEGSGTEIPLTIVPDEVDELLNEKTPDGEPEVAAATVYVLAEEFERFCNCLERHAEQGKPRVDEPLHGASPPNRLGPPNAARWWPARTETQAVWERRWEAHGRWKKKHGTWSTRRIAIQIAKEELRARMVTEEVESRSETIRKQLGTMLNHGGPPRN